MFKQIDKLAVRSAYNGVAAKYDQAHLQRKSIAENYVLRWLLKGMGGGPVLDLGCGTGELIEIMGLDPCHYFGLDLAPGMISRAREKHPRYTFEVGDMEDLRMTRGSWPCITSIFGGFSYTAGDRVADEIARVLEPGGRFLVMAMGHKYATRRSYVLRGQGV